MVMSETEKTEVVDSEIENAKPDSAVKRKRGRPRLPESAKKPPKDPNAPKRGRGRPRIYPPGMRPSQSRSENTGRPRGRPRKVPLDKNGQTEGTGASPTKEPRGRPPKKAKIEPEAVPQEGAPRSPLKVALKSVSAKLTKGDNGSDVEKKGHRGRPKKEKVPSKTAASGDVKPKGKRGRPPKAAAMTAESS